MHTLPPQPMNTGSVLARGTDLTDVLNQFGGEYNPAQKTVSSRAREPPFACIHLHSSYLPHPTDLQ